MYVDFLAFSGFDKAVAECGVVQGTDKRKRLILGAGMVFGFNALTQQSVPSFAVKCQRSLGLECIDLRICFTFEQLLTVSLNS